MVDSEDLRRDGGSEESCSGDGVLHRERVCNVWKLVRKV